MAGLKKWIRQRLELARDGLITLLGGATEDELKRLELQQFTELAHIHRRTKAMTYYHAFDEAKLFNPKAKPRSKTLQFIINLNDTDRWLAVPVKN